MDDPRDHRSPEQVLADAEAYGVDLTLIEAQLRRMPEARVRMLSENLELFRAVDRARELRLAARNTDPVAAWA